MNHSNPALEKSSPTQTCILQCGLLEVRCLWSGDRFRHEIYLANSQAQEPILTSIEGCDQDQWPVSPPFQQIVKERLDDKLDTLLGVGMSGRSHWSCSIHYDSVMERIQFDIACRYPAKPERLGSSYRSLLPMVSVREKCVQWSSGGSRLILESMDELSTLTQLSQEDIYVQPTHVSEKYPATSRWVYSLRWE